MLGRMTAEETIEAFVVAVTNLSEENLKEAVRQLGEGDRLALGDLISDVENEED